MYPKVNLYSKLTFYSKCNYEKKLMMITFLYDDTKYNNIKKHATDNKLKIDISEYKEYSLRDTYVKIYNKSAIYFRRNLFLSLTLIKIMIIL